MSTKTSNGTYRTLPPLAWALEPLPEPVVFESNSEFAWMEFDKAVHELDMGTPDGRAWALANS